MSNKDSCCSACSGTPGGVASVASTNVPRHVHTLNIFLASALYKHSILFSRTNQKKLEQWIESVVRLYVHDRTRTQRLTTLRWMHKQKTCVWKSIEAVFSFESIIHDALPTRMAHEEGAVSKAWRALYAEVDKAMAAHGADDE